MNVSGSIVAREKALSCPLGFPIYIWTVMKEVKMGMGRMGGRFLEEGREWILHGLLYPFDWFCMVNQKRGLKCW